MTGADRALLARVQRAIRAAAVAIPTRARVRVGPFDLYCETVRPDHWFTFAVPDDGAEPSAQDVAALREACRLRDRLPRVECLPALAPVAVAALRDGGFAVDLRGPLMICTAPGRAPEVPGLTLEQISPESQDAAIADFDRVQRAAFGDPPAPVDLAASRSRLAHGTALLARLGGEAVGTGIAVPPTEGCAEIVGIGTLDGFRGRGVAAAVTAALVREAFAADGTELAFLTPGGPEAQRIYERAGFRGAGEFLHLSSAS